jgi:hypothetical protein
VRTQHRVRVRLGRVFVCACASSARGWQYCGRRAAALGEQPYRPAHSSCLSCFPSHSRCSPGAAAVGFHAAAELGLPCCGCCRNSAELGHLAKGPIRVSLCGGLRVWAQASESLGPARRPRRRNISLLTRSNRASECKGPSKGGGGD